MAIIRVREAFAAYDKTQKALRSFCPGDLFSSDDPVVKGKEHLFEPVEVAAARNAGVEDATAEPGALRSMSTVPKRGRPKKVEPEPASLEEE